MLLGLRTAIYHTPDIDAGKRWYTKVLDVAPYFDQPFYVGFNVGGFELGLSPDAGPDGRCSVGAYWGVKDIAVAPHWIDYEDPRALGNLSLGRREPTSAVLALAAATD